MWKLCQHARLGAQRQTSQQQQLQQLAQALHSGRAEAQWGGWSAYFCIIIMGLCPRHAPVGRLSGSHRCCVLQL